MKKFLSLDKSPKLEMLFHKIKIAFMAYSVGGKEEMSADLTINKCQLLKNRSQNNKKLFNLRDKKQINYKMIKNPKVFIQLMISHHKHNKYR